MTLPRQVSVTYFNSIYQKLQRKNFQIRVSYVKLEENQEGEYP